MFCLKTELRNFCNDTSGFMSNIDNLCLLSCLSVSLTVCLFYWSFEGNNFFCTDISLFSIVFCLHCHWFLFCISFLSDLGLLYSFSSFLIWKLILLIWDFYSFQMYAFNGIICPLSTILAVSYKFLSYVVIFTQFNAFLRISLETFSLIHILCRNV